MQPFKRNGGRNQMPRGKKQRARSSVYDELTPEAIKGALSRRQAQAEEYGKWVASMDIPVPFGTVLAYTQGSPVPSSNVERWDYDQEVNYVGQVCVVLQDSDEGRALLESLGMLNNVHPDLLANVDTQEQVDALLADQATPTAEEGK
jgi:hypothetical protein